MSRGVLQLHKPYLSQCELTRDHTTLCQVFTVKRFVQGRLPFFSFVVVGEKYSKGFEVR